MKINLSDYPLDHPVVGWAVAQELGIETEILSFDDEDGVNLMYVGSIFGKRRLEKPNHKSPDVMVQLMEWMLKKHFRMYFYMSFGMHHCSITNKHQPSESYNAMGKTPIAAVLACFVKMKGEVDVPEGLL